MRPDGEADGDVALLAFEVDACRFAIPLGTVIQVARAVAITRLPKAPAVVNGLIELRGRLVVVLDVRSRFGFAPRQPDASEHLIIAMADERLVALRADWALDVIQIPVERIVNLADAVAHTDYVAGVARLDDGLLLIHDLGTFLTESEGLAIDAGIEAAGGEVGHA